MGLNSFDNFQDYTQPYNWWGYHWTAPVPLSAVQLIQAGSMDASLGALLWLMMERRSSIVVASEPALAGKTATLTALLDFLPPDTEKVYLRGMEETFEFVGRVGPESSYLLCNEISPDLPTYIWGDKAATVFQLMGDGYKMGSTMHAGSVEKVVSLLEDGLSVPRPLIARLTLVLLLDMNWAGLRVNRRVRSLHLLQEDESGELATFTLAERFNNGLVHDPEPAFRYLERFGAPVEKSRRELGARRDFLECLDRSGVTDVSEVRKAIDRYPAGVRKRRRRPL